MQPTNKQIKNDLKLDVIHQAMTGENIYVNLYISYPRVIYVSESDQTGSLNRIQTNKNYHLKRFCYKIIRGLKNEYPKFLSNDLQKCQYHREYTTINYCTIIERIAYLSQLLAHRHFVQINFITLILNCHT